MEVTARPKGLASEKLQSRQHELYVFAQSRDPVAKERSKRLRELRGLLGRLKVLQIMKLSARNLLLKSTTVFPANRNLTGRQGSVWCTRH